MIERRYIVWSLTVLLVVSVIGVGTVTSNVLAADRSDGDDTRVNATTMAVGSTANGTIESSDVDWYAVEIESGERIDVSITITTENNENLRFDIFDPDGEKTNEYPNDALGASYATQRMISGNNASGGDVAEQSGTYYVRVKSAGEPIENRTGYELTVETEELDQHDPNEQPVTATRIESDDTISGVLSGSDRDTYAIDLEKGETITINISSTKIIFLNPYLAGPNASNETLDSYDEDYAVAQGAFGSRETFNYTANTTGTYYLRIIPDDDESTIGSFDYEIPYEVSVDVSGSDEDDSEDATDDSNESKDESEDKNENDSTETSSDTDYSEQTEDSPVDDSDTSSSDTEPPECDEESTATDGSDCSSMDTSSDRSDCDETSE